MKKELKDVVDLGGLESIASLVPAGLEVLTRHTDEQIASAPCTHRIFYEVADVERWAASHAASTAGEVLTVDELKATLAMANARLAELSAARYAYASEFPLNDDGEPDVGSIHANIRALKAQVASHAGAVAVPASTLLQSHIDHTAKFLRPATPSTAAVRAAEIPAGWKLVPELPTFEMQRAASTAARSCKLEDGQPAPLPTGYELWSSTFVYRAMLAAAPVPAADGGNGGEG